MKELEKYITDERTELKYEFICDNCLIAGDNEPKKHSQSAFGGSGG